MEETKRMVKEFILQEFLPGEDPEELLDSTPLVSGGILDSLATLKLVAFLEEEFGIEIDAHEADVDHLDTIFQNIDTRAFEKIIGDTLVPFWM